MKTQQYRPSPSNEERMRRLDEVIPQDIEGVGDNDWYTKDGEGHQKVGRGNKHHINGNRRNDFDGKHQ